MKSILLLLSCFGIILSLILCKHGGKSEEVEDGGKQVFWPARGRRSFCTNGEGNFEEADCGVETLKWKHSKPELWGDLWASELKEDFRKHPLLSAWEDPSEGSPQEETNRGHHASNFPGRTDERRIEPGSLQAIIGFLRDQQQIRRRNVIDPKIDPDKPFWPARG